MFKFVKIQKALISSFAKSYQGGGFSIKTPSFTFPESFLNKKKIQLKRNSPFGYGGLGEIVYKRTYARENEDYVDTTARVVKGTMNLYSSHLSHVSGPESVDHGFLQDLGQEMFESMFELKFLPPGRGLWAMGSPITEERHLYAALNNCGFVSTGDMKTNPIDPFTFLMDASMLGVGVGFDTLGAGQISIVDKNHSFGQFTYVIPDSREGWVNALRYLLRHYFVPGNRHPLFNYSLIRPAGAPIKGFGGVSGGPEPLKHALEEIDMILDVCRGQLISVTNIVDIMNIIGKCIVSGNVRRTAEIAFGDPASKEFLDLKNYTKNPHRSSFGWTSNNSIIATHGMDYKPIVDRIYENGEPGLFWLKTAQDYSRLCDPPDRKDKHAKGSNPCVTGDTIVLTTHGPKRAVDLIGIPFDAIVDNSVHRSPSGMFCTGFKAVYQIKTKEGFLLRLTKDHRVLIATQSTYTKRDVKWVRAKNLLYGDKIVLNNSRLFKGWNGDGDHNEGWLVGALVGSNSFDYIRKTARFCFKGDAKLSMYDIMMDKIRAVPSLCHLYSEYLDELIRDPENPNFSSHELWDLCFQFGARGTKNLNPAICHRTSSEFQRGFVSGIFDTCVSTSDLEKDRYSLKIRLDSGQYSSAVQKMLLNFGVVSSVCMRRDYASIYPCIDDEDSPDAEYQGTFRFLTIKHDNMLEFKTKFGLSNFVTDRLFLKNLKSYAKPPHREKFIATFESLDFIKHDMVYDCTVNDIHRFSADGLVIHNCLEQTLEPYELCCLVETFPARHEKLDDFLRTLELAFFYAKVVTLGPTHWPQTNRVMSKNRRIGTSMSGIVQFIAKNGLDALKHWCMEGYQTLRIFDTLLSSQLKVPESNKRTSIKPSGTVSITAGATPGMHYPISKNYIRRVRFPSNSPLLIPLQKAGYFIEDAKDGITGSTKVVEFPISVSDENIPKVEDVSVWQQFSLAAFLQEYWADNSVSCTVTFNPKKTSRDEIVSVLEFYQYKLKGVSLLPHVESGAYPQMPYESIDEATYHQRIQDIKPIEWDDASNQYVEPKEKTFCDSDVCERKLE